MNPDRTFRPNKYEIEAFAKRNNLKLFFVSSKTGKNLFDLFHEIEIQIDAAPECFLIE